MIAAVVLAAGASTRLGRPKQLVEVEARSLVWRAVAACVEAGCSPVMAVVGYASVRVRGALADTTATVIENPQWPEGMASSIRAGLNALDPRTQAVVLTVCDQPELSAAVIRRLMEAWDGNPRAIVACVYAGTIGVPSLFGRSWFDELAGLRGEQGAKGLLEANRERVRIIEWPPGARDLDLPGDEP